VKFAACALLSAVCVFTSSSSIALPVPAEDRGVVTASAGADGVRVTAGPEIVGVRLQVLTAGSEVLFDSGWRGGNLLDWSLDDAFGNALAAGVYRASVSTRSVDGSVVTRGATIRLGSQQPVIESGEIAVALESGPRMTRLMHDGEAGRLVTTAGALSFRFGDYLARNDAEAMRLTPAGDLDVAGVIRAGKGLQFPDGSVQQTAAMSTTLQLPGNSDFHLATDVAGTGTTNKVTKWTDTSGTLGDSAISEVGGKVGIGTITPGGLLHVFGPATADVFAGFGPDVVAGPAMNYGYAGTSFGRSAGFFNMRPDLGALAPNPSLRFMTANTQRVIITNLGNVGIGTGFTSGTAPTEKVEILGNIKILGGGNKLIFPDTTFMTTAGATLGANTFSGDQSVLGIITASAAVSASVINATSDYRLSSARVLYRPDPDSIAVGPNAGTPGTAGFDVFVGAFTGSGTTGPGNTFVGAQAGESTTIAADNTFIGHQAGRSNGTSSYNSYVGSFAGGGSTGGFNTLLGAYSAFTLTTGQTNVAIGYNAGGALASGDDNVLIGSNSAGTTALTNSTAIGARASVTQNNSLVLGSISGVNGASANTTVGIGTTSPWATLDVRSNDINGSAISIGLTAAPDFPAGANSLFVGNDSGDPNNSLRLDGASDRLYIIARKGAGSVTDPQIVFRTGSIDGPEQDRASISGSGVVNINGAGTSTATFLTVNGAVGLNLAAATGSTSVCWDSTSKLLTLCSSSLQFKSDVTDFAGGLDVIERLHPVTFKWKDNQTQDVGFIAEEVEKVEPRLAIYAPSGEVHGVKYDHLSVVIVNAIKEQEKELVRERETTLKLKAENDELRTRLSRLERAVERLTQEK